MIKISINKLIDELIVVNANDRNVDGLQERVTGAMLRAIKSVEELYNKEKEQIHPFEVEYEKEPQDEYFNQMIESLIKTETRIKRGHDVIKYKTLAESKEDLIRDIANYINSLPPFMPSGAVMLGIVRVTETAFEVPVEPNQPK